MLASEAITAGFREADIIPLGTVPKESENTEALGRLNDFWRSILGFELGENVMDWPVPAPVNSSQPAALQDYSVDSVSSGEYWRYPVQNSRILATLTQANLTIFFPKEPDDGARISWVDVGSAAVSVTLSGNGRKIEGQTSITATTASALNGVTWFYRADLASWERVVDMGLNSPLPLPQEFNDLFITYIAIRMSPRNSQDALKETRTLHDTVMRRVKARYRQSQGVGISARALSETEQTFGNHSAWS